MGTRQQLLTGLAGLALSIPLLIGGTAHAAPTPYGLALDWSDSSNPNGAWAYGLRNGTTFSAFGLHVPAYVNVGPPAFAGAQPAWTRCADTGSNGCPEGLARSTGIALLDFPAGRVGGHTPLNGALAVQWTAPADGVIDVSGGTWMWLDFQGRRLVHSLLLNDVPIFDSVLIPTQASGTGSASPYTFDQSLIDVGGDATDLDDIVVHAGDRLTWAVARAPGSVEWFAGIDLDVIFTPATPGLPEPGALALGLSGLALMAAIAPRRRRSG